MARKPSPHPEWALKWKRPGTELRCIHGRYCLYECTSFYDKEAKKTRKKTGKYLGSITEADGFVPSKKRDLEEKMERVQASSSLQSLWKEIQSLLLSEKQWLLYKLQEDLSQSTNENGGAHKGIKETLSNVKE